MPIEIHQLTINSNLGGEEKDAASKSKGSGKKKNDPNAAETETGISIVDLNHYLSEFREDLLDECKQTIRLYVEERRER